MNVKIISEKIIFLSTYVITPNFLFWVVMWFLDLQRPFFNLDYFFAALLFAFGWRLLALIFVGVFYFFDLMLLISQIFPFVGLGDVGYFLTMLPYASGIYQAGFVVVIINLALVGVVGVLFSNRKNVLVALVFFNIALCVYALGPYWSEGGTNKARVWRASSEWMVDSQTITFLDVNYLTMFSKHGRDVVALKEVGFQGKTADIVSNDYSDLGDRVLLVVVESFGVMKDPLVQSDILSPLLERVSDYKSFEQGAIGFKGATVAAELRELCGLYPYQFNLKPVDHGFEDCVPNKLKELGYRTEAIHGSFGAFYDRIYWYPRVGFEKITFRENSPWRSQCFSFPGACDEEILEKSVLNSFLEDGKKFVYFLTLNSHSMYDERDIKIDLFDCSSHGIPVLSETCRMLKLHKQFFFNFSALLTHEQMLGVDVILVGDHSPRILNSSEYNEYVEDDLVPWIRFMVE